MLIGAGLGLLGGGLKSIFDGKRYDKQKQLAAETTRWSPWTGMVGEMPEAPDTFGNMLQFGTTGAMLNQGIDQMGAQNDFNQQLLNKLPSSSSSTFAGMAQGPASMAGRFPFLVPGAPLYR